MTEKILITGGAGFIGSNLVELLSKNSHKYTILDVRSNVNYSRNLVNPKDYIQGDVRDKALLKSILLKEKFRGIIHLAAISRVISGEKDPKRCKSVNIEGLRALLDTISNTKHKPWFIFTSNREVYGNSKVLPVKESYPLKPINTYGQAKVIGEKIVKEYSLKSNSCGRLFHKNHLEEWMNTSSYCPVCKSKL